MACACKLKLVDVGEVTRYGCRSQENGIGQSGFDCGIGIWLGVDPRTGQHFVFDLSQNGTRHARTLVRRPDVQKLDRDRIAAISSAPWSIHQAANPQMYEESYNPLMAATFPERYTKTPEDFIVQGGIQAPRSMTEKDAAQATAFGNKVQNIENLDYNPVEQSRLDKALAAVTASRRFNP